MSQNLIIPTSSIIPTNTLKNQLFEVDGILYQGIGGINTSNNRYEGSSAVPLLRTVDTISDLKNLKIEGLGIPTYIQTLGYYSIGDGYGAIYSSDTNGLLEDGGSVIKPTYAGFNGDLRWVTTFDSIVNVKNFGAKGDFIQDDTQAIYNAINYLKTNYNGGTVFFPEGNYSFSSDINLVEGITLLGINPKITILRWSGESDPLIAGIVSNQTEAIVMHSTGLSNIKIDMNGYSNGLNVKGWNENCFLQDVEIIGYTGTGFVASAVESPDITPTQNASISRLRLVAHEDGADVALDLNDLKRIVFNSLTIDSPVNATGGNAIGIKLNGTRQLLFQGYHVEDCLLPISIGESSACSQDVFMCGDIYNPTIQLAERTIDSVLSTVEVMVYSGTIRYSFQAHSSTGDAPDYLLVDEGRAENLIGQRLNLVQGFETALFRDGVSL